VTRSRGLLVLALVVGVAVGCAKVPTDGPVRFESMGTSEPEQTSLPVLVTGPDPGDSPQQVVRGFLDSMASYQAGHPSAREYLSPEVSERWQPARVLIYDSAAVPLVETKPGKVVIDVPQLAEVGANGAWTATPGEKLELDLKMTQVDGEWRIGQPPDALIMSMYNFNREYDQYNLYFYDPEFEILVPDPVYLPNRGHVETLLVNALIRGPSPWLEPAVRSALPKGTRLAAPSVPIDNNVATVDLERNVADLSDSQRRFLHAQLFWTLSQVSGVTRVQATVDRVPLGVEEPDVRVATAAWSTYDPAVAGAAQTAYALSGGRVVVVGADRLVPVSGPLGRVRLNARSIAVSVFGERSSGQPVSPDESASRDWLAAVSADGREVRIFGSDGSARTIYTGRDVMEPSWDRTGKVWLVDRRSGSARIVAVDEQDAVVPVVASGLAGEDVRALKISRDGARVAALVRRGDRTVLVIGRVHRTDRLTIQGVREIPLEMSSMTDLAWSGLDQVAVIGSEAQSPPSPTLVSVDGSTVDPLTAGPEPRTIAAAPDQPVLLSSDAGRLHVEDKNYMWSPLGEGTSPAYPG
jgi:Lipoprotein LpqB beta-propeller domain/Sporulation and spore germination